MKKWLITIFAIIASVCFAFGLTACDYYDELDENGWEYISINEGTEWKINGYSGSATEVCIPSFYKDKPVTVLGPSIINDKVVKVTFADDTQIVRIGESAFESSQGLKRVHLPKNIVEIENCAFEWCEALESVTFEENSKLEKISWRAFERCKSLKEIEIPAGVKTIESSVFWDCTALERIVIPSLVTHIDDFVFNGCSSLEEVVLPEGIKSIGSRAFAGCVSLSSIEIPNGIETFGEEIFEDCNDIDLYFLGSADEWAQKNFEGELLEDNCKLYFNGALATNVVIQTATSISDYAFCNLKQLLSVDMLGSVEKIGERSFYNCTSLRSVVIPESVTTIGNSAFFNCSLLQNIEIPDTVTEIHDAAFYGCLALEEIQFGENSQLQRIESFAFSNCESLKTVNLLKNRHLESIAYGAFRYCYRVESAAIPSSVINVDANVFYECFSLPVIQCELASKPTTWNDDWNNRACPAIWDCSNNDVADDGCVYVTIDGLNYGVKDGNAVLTKQHIDTIEATIKSRVTVDGQTYPVTGIIAKAFARCEQLRRVTFEDTEGWTAGEEQIPSQVLSNLQIAANHLRLTKNNFAWSKQ